MELKLSFFIWHLNFSRFFFFSFLDLLNSSFDEKNRNKLNHSFQTLKERQDSLKSKYWKSSLHLYLCRAQ